MGHPTGESNDGPLDINFDRRPDRSCRNATMCELPSRENSTVAAHYVALERYFVGRRLLYAALQAGGCPANLGNVGSNLCFIPTLSHLVAAVPRSTTECRR